MQQSWFIVNVSCSEVGFSHIAGVEILFFLILFIHHIAIQRAYRILFLLCSPQLHLNLELHCQEIDK